MLSVDRDGDQRHSADSARCLRDDASAIYMQKSPISIAASPHLRDLPSALSEPFKPPRSPSPSSLRAPRASACAPAPCEPLRSRTRLCAPRALQVQVFRSYSQSSSTPRHPSSLVKWSRTRRTATGGFRSVGVTGSDRESLSPILFFASGAAAITTVPSFESFFAFLRVARRYRDVVSRKTAYRVNYQQA